MRGMLLFDLRAGGYALSIHLDAPGEDTDTGRRTVVWVTGETPQFFGRVRSEVWDHGIFWYGLDLVALRQGLVSLQERPAPENSFDMESTEGHIGLRFEFDLVGHMAVRVRLEDELHNARLEYTIEADQSYLPGLIDALTAGLREHKLL